MNISKKIVNFGAYSLCSQIQYLEEGVPFLQVGNITENNIVGIFKYIDEKLSKNILSKSIVQENQILLTIAGTIGHAVVAQGLPEGTNSNQAIANITLQSGINPFYVSTFLNSIYGKYQSKRLIVSNVQPNLLLIQVKSIKVPLFSQSFQSEVGGIVKKAHEAQSQAKELYKYAETLLLKELGLLGYEPKNRLSFETTKKEVDKANRFDAEYFQPKYKKIIEKIERYKGGVSKVNVKFAQNTTLSKKDKDYYNYIEIGDINISNGEVNFNKIQTSFIPENGKIELEKGNLLISKVRPYRGAVGIINSEIKNLLGSGAFTVLKESSDYKKEVLQVLLRTKYIKDYLLKFNVGTSYPVIKDEDILNLKIPLISASIQSDIAKKVTESHRLRNQSKDFLNIAKQAVELAIEKGEVDGLALIQEQIMEYGIEMKCF